jgi:hypothetical protein
MFIRTVMLPLAVMLALVASPAPAAAQDASPLLQELQKAVATPLPPRVTLHVSGSGYKAGAGDERVHYRIAPTTLDLSSSDPDNAWTPIGFLAAAASNTATLATDTLFGTEYQVITVTLPAGQVVRGYVRDKVLERVRTETAGAKSKTLREAVFFDWREFRGLRLPSLIIQKEDGRVSRILVIGDVSYEGQPAADAKS